MTESMEHLRNAKARLRRVVGDRLRALSELQRRDNSRRLCARLRAQPYWQTADTILFFAPLPTEPDIWPMLIEALAAGKTVALPRFHPPAGTYRPAQIRRLPDDLTRGPLGIREPSGACPEIRLERVDLVLVPGRAFDLRGQRLGRGKGHYDRLLAGFTGLTCGVAFDEQVVARLDVQAHDVPVRALVTPTRALWFGPETTTPATAAGGR